MAVDPSVVINIAAEYTGKKAFSKAETATKSLTKGVKSLAGAFGLAFGARGAMQAVKAFAADDKAAKTLSKTLNNLGLAFADPAVKKFINDLERQYGVLDDKLRPAYQMLLTSTGDYIKSQDLLRTALDLSAMSGVDVVSVAADLSKAYQGNTRGLMKYQLGLDKAELAAMSFEEILAKVAEVSSGQAQIAADSYAGSLDKLTVAGANVAETLGKDLVDALAILGGEGGLPKTISLIESVTGALGAAIIYAARFARVLDIITGSGIFNMYGDLTKAFAEFEAQDKARAIGKSPNAGMATSYQGKKAQDALVAAAALAAAKKLAIENKKIAAAALAAANAKKLSLALDKANLALAKGTDVFDMDKIQLNAALIGQAEALGKATTGAQILAIANDVQRLKVKQSINELEDAIASKDVARIESATKQLNADLKILGTLQNQNFTLLSIKTVLDTLTPKELINQNNLDMALDKIRQMLALLANMQAGVTAKTISPITAAALGAGITFNPNQNKDRNYDQNVLGIGGAMPASLNMPVAGVDFNPNQQRDRNYTNNVINVNAGVIGDENIIVDAVQNALNEIARRGYTTTYAGAIAV